MGKTAENTIFTIGHSTKNREEFIDILKMRQINLVVDVRRAPYSRNNPQFNKETLTDELKKVDIKYIHTPQLGGMGRPLPDSSNMSWENKSFRGYADYMQTKEFTENLLNLITLAREHQVAVMCAEAIPWRCHRILISDALVARSIIVKHILNADNYTNHELTSFAHIEGLKITYPLFAQVKPQRTLADFGSST
jgi:uncharacterized protein (DUF488 family)